MIPFNVNLFTNYSRISFVSLLVTHSFRAPSRIMRKPFATLALGSSRNISFQIMVAKEIRSTMTM